MRKAITNQELQQKVYDAVQVFIKNRAEFSAYSITLYLRDKNPDVEIVHDLVQDAVHYLCTGNHSPNITLEQRAVIPDYYVDWKLAPDGEYARVYFYKSQQPIISINATIPQIPNPPSSNVPIKVASAGLLQLFRSSDDDPKSV